MANRLREDRGVTLLELMFACGIMAIALSLLFGSMVTISLANKVTESHAIAATHIISVMEEIRSAPATVLSYVPPTLGGGGAGAAIEVQCYAAGDEPITLPVAVDAVTTVFPNPLHVECTAKWLDERGHEFSLAASEWIFR